ncbi:MAG: zf-HC2 domain-containing protein [Gemmatimonadaceae bacterium]
MADCSNVEIRELLPERAAGALSAADLARVDAHLASCETCSSELALIQAARRAVRVTPSIDVGRISAAVVAATVTPSRPQLVTTGRAIAPARPAPRLRWIGLRAAAAVAIAAAGIGSFAVWHSANETAGTPGAGAVAAATALPSTSAPPTTSIAEPASPTVVASAATGSSSEPTEIGVAGGLSDLSASDLRSLLGDLGSSVGVADDASFEEPAPVILDVGDISGGESL